MSRFVLKILSADITKTRLPGFDASAAISVKRHQTIIAVNQRELFALANNYRDRLHVSFRFVLAAVIAMFMPTRHQTPQRSLGERLSFIE